MKKSLNFCLSLCGLCMSLGDASQAFAQQAAPAAPPAAEAASPVDPFGGAVDNPAVRAALEWPRTNPSHAFRAVVVLVDLGRPELARPILDELHARGLSDSERAALVGEFGSHRMLQIGRVEALAPVGRELAEASMAAAAAIAADPQRLTLLVSQLTDPSPEVRLAAQVDLASAGQAGATTVLEALARESDAQRRSALLAAAARLQPLVNGPLLAMLETKDAALRRDVANLLVGLQVSQAVPLLAPSGDPLAEPTVIQSLDEYRHGRPPFAADEENQVELWYWNDSNQTLASARYPADEARVIWMSRLAMTLAQLRPDHRPYRRQGMLLVAEASGLIGLSTIGAASPPPGIEILTVRWPAADSRLTNDVLSDALAANYAHAAVAAIDELGRRADPSVLLTADSRPSPLADALVHGDRRVRFAALRAIVALDPPTAFPGSSRVAEALAFFARGAGRREAVVAMPSPELAADVAGKLAAVDVQGEATYFGSDVALMADRMADLEMILLDMDILRRDVRQTLYQLRVMPASRHVPVALLAADGRLEAAHRLAEEHDCVIAVPRPYSPDAVTRIAERLWAISIRNATSPEERARQAVEAVRWIAVLLERGRTFYALRREGPAVETALYQPAAAASAIDALARFGTPASQRALVNFASQRTLPIESRRRAAAAFAASVQVDGILLTNDEILSQYTIYNASESADSDTQQVLGALLDAIESRRTAPVAAASQQ